MRTSGGQAAMIQAVVIRRADASGTGASGFGPRRVINRALGPGMASGTGKIRLLGDDLEAFRAGRLSVAVFGGSGADPIAEVQISAR